MKKWSVAGRASYLAVCAASAQARHRHAAVGEADEDHAPAQVGAAGAVRRLLRGARLKGYYKAQGLDVKLKNGGPDIIPEQVVASAARRSSASTGCRACSPRVTRAPTLVNIAQVFARSGMTQLTWKCSGINSIAKMKGKKVANWLGGNQYELFAALTKNGMDPAKNKGVTIVQQPFDMNLFLKHQVDSASAMTYNELAQVLESKNPKTGKLYKLSDLNVLKMQNVGTGMLEDGLFSTESYLASKAHQADRREGDRRDARRLDLLP